MTLLTATCPVCHADIGELHVVNGSRITNAESEQIEAMKVAAFENHPNYSPQCESSPLWKIENVNLT